MQEARAAGCALAVFPRCHSADRWIRPGFPSSCSRSTIRPCARCAALSGELGVGAVFGISECSDTGVAHITQVVAEHGRVVGVQRKRHLGEDEVAYTASDSDAVFDLAGARCAIAICRGGRDRATVRPRRRARRPPSCCSARRPACGAAGSTRPHGGAAGNGGAGTDSATRAVTRDRTGCGSRWRRRPGRPETRTSPVSPRSSTPRGSPRRAAGLASGIAGRRRSAPSDLGATATFIRPGAQAWGGRLVTVTLPARGSCSECARARPGDGTDRADPSRHRSRVRKRSDRARPHSVEGMLTEV